MKCTYSLSCHSPAVLGAKFCQTHRDDHLRRTTESRLRRIAAKPAGECRIPHCTRPGWRGRKLCKKHVMVSREAAARARLKPRQVRASRDIDAFIRDEVQRLFQERRFRR